MPAHPDTPEPLKTAFEDMERIVQGFKTDLAYAAPEIQDRLWGGLQMDLAETLADLYIALTNAPSS